LLAPPPSIPAEPTPGNIWPTASVALEMACLTAPKEAEDVLLLIALLSCPEEEEEEEDLLSLSVSESSRACSIVLASLDFKASVSAPERFDWAFEPCCAC